MPCCLLAAGRAPPCLLVAVGVVLARPRAATRPPSEPRPMLDEEPPQPQALSMRPWASARVADDASADGKPSQTRLSWLEAAARAESRAAEFLPGASTVDQMASRARSRRVLRRSVWIGYETGVAYRTFICFIHLLNFGLVGVMYPFLLRSYVSVSMFSLCLLYTSPSPRDS